jgi:hypothetical protein
MGIFGGGGLLRYLALGFGALLVGMQIGYTVHYTTVSSSDADTRHRDAYEYLMALHDLQAEGLIGEADLKFLVSRHRAEVGGAAAGAGGAGARVGAGGDGGDSGSGVDQHHHQAAVEPPPQAVRDIVQRPAVVPHQGHVANKKAGSSVEDVPVTVQLTEKAAEPKPVAYGLCDGGDPKEKKMVFIKVRSPRRYCGAAAVQRFPYF